MRGGKSLALYWKGRLVVYGTALERRHTIKGIGSSNLPPSAVTTFYRERIAESTVTNLKMARITLLLALADYCFYFCVLI